MKRIAILIIFVVLFSIFSSNVFAESNPLLTIFEGIKVEANFDLIEEAIRGYGLEETSIYLVPKEGVNSFTISWQWLDENYMGTIAPTAYLFVDVEVDNTSGYRKVKNVIYRYSFLYFERELKLVPESQTELTREEREEAIKKFAKDLAKLHKILRGEMQTPVEKEE